MKAQSWQELEWEVVTQDLSRKIVTGENIMVAQIRLAKGALVPEHSHPNEQISQILHGALRFWLPDQELVLVPGQVLVIPPGVPHKALALEDTLAFDCFSPIRQDWLDHTDTYFHRRDPSSST